MDALRQLAPAEDPQAQEGRLEEECEQAFDRQRRAEDVAHESAVVAPVHAELELLNDARDHAHGEVDQEQFAVEARQPQVLLIGGSNPGRLEARHDERQRDRERHEEKVVDGRDCELPPRKVKGVHTPLPCDSSGSAGYQHRDRGPHGRGLLLAGIGPRASGKVSWPMAAINIKGIANTRSGGAKTYLLGAAAGGYSTSSRR